LSRALTIAAALSAWPACGGSDAASSDADANLGDATAEQTPDNGDAAGADADPGDGGPPTSSCTYATVAPKVLFHIGHSLTDRMADLLTFMVEAETGEDVPYAYKSIAGSSLYYHWTHPDDGLHGSIRTGTPLEVLRSGRFDALILTESTGIDSLIVDPERDSRAYANLWVDEFLAYASTPRPEVFVYSTWYQRAVGAPDTDESIAEWLRQGEERQPLWEELAQAIVDAHPGIPVHIVPGGLVLSELQERVLGGSLTLPGSATFRDTFFKQNRPGRYGGCAVRDHIHLSETGIYAIAVTHYATVYRSCPIGLPTSIPYSGYDDGCVTADSIDVDAALAAVIQEVAWNVARTYPWAGLSDGP
jgi:hypothetical protein